ncbi:transcription elongation factor GreA [Enterobacter hormaechei]
MDYGVNFSDPPCGLVEYTNVPSTIATVISAGKATLHELDTVYGLEDLWMLIEIIQVDRHNEAVLNKAE